MSDLISRQAAIEALGEEPLVWTDTDEELAVREQWRSHVDAIKSLPPAQPERLTDDDFETIRIHLNAYKENLCNQHRWEEAEEYERIIDRFMAFASVQPEQRWIPVSERLPEDLQEVNVTWVNRNQESYYADIKDKPFTATAVFYGGCWYWYSAICTDTLGEYGENDIDLIDNGIEITAWQPLPEPYKGGEE